MQGIDLIKQGFVICYKMNMEQCREKILLMLALNVIISLAIFHLRILCFELMFLAMYVVVVTTKDIAFCIEIEW